jgi:hypothetical protein
VNTPIDALPAYNDADRIDQSIPVAPDDDLYPDPLPVTWEADPADLIEQSIPTPYPDDDAVESPGPAAAALLGVDTD